MISVRGASKFFGSIKAVDDVSFEIGKGEIVGLLGPNGAGKTTTMRLIAGYLSPDSGEIFVGGVRASSGILTKGMIGYLPENAPLYPDMEVREMLAYFAKLKGVASSKIKKSCLEVADKCGLRSMYARPISQLSKGFKQRTGLALALICEPSILIFDEPTSGLDPNQIAEIRALIREIGRERTVVLSTHIMQEVEATCERAIIIDKGKLVGEGTLQELKSRRSKGALFDVSLRAQRSDVEKALPALPGFKCLEFHEAAGVKRLKLVLSGPGNDDAGEDIFKWAYGSGLSLFELTRRPISLEEVFRELTTEANKQS